MTHQPPQQAASKKRTIATKKANTLALSQLSAIRHAGILSDSLLMKLAGDAVPVANKARALLEADCARRLNFVMPDNDLAQAVLMMETVVKDLTGADDCALFSFDEETGIYSCLSDEKNQNQAKPRELTRISDDFLQNWMGVPTHALLHAHLMVGVSLVGLVVVTNPKTPEALELLNPYLATKIYQFKTLKAALILPYKQDLLIDLSNRLVSAADKESMITETMDLFWSRMGFSVCQYVEVEKNEAPTPKANGTLNGNGLVWYESVHGRLKSFFHAGLMSKRHVVKDFSSLISLLSSGWRKTRYLLLSGGQLGDRSLAEIFGVKNAQSVLMLPVTDVQTGKIIGTLNLFQTNDVEIAPQTLDILMTISDLVSNAVGRARVLEKALAMATLDELTGLVNRRGFYDRFGAEVERARRHPTTLCVAMIDVDFFKQLNDTYGHLSGDCVLKALAERFLKSVRKSDVVCRFGGEEFAILLPDMPMHAATDLVERIRRSVADTPVPGVAGEALKVTVSIGLAPVVLNTETIKQDPQVIISEALSQADMALYQAKNAGRNQVRSAQV